MQNLSLPRCQIVRHSVRRDIPARQKTHADRSRLLNELRLRVPRPDAQLDDLLCAAPPPLEQASPVENVGDQRIARARRMIVLEVFNAQTERQRVFAPNFKPVLKLRSER